MVQQPNQDFTTNYALVSIEFFFFFFFFFCLDMSQYWAISFLLQI